MEFSFSGNAKGKDKTTAKNSVLIGCKIYVSEGRNPTALDAIERAGKGDRESPIVNKYSDQEYNRIRYTLVSYLVNDSAAGFTYSPMRQVLYAMAEAAYRSVNLEMHCGAHPRVGVVDHISFHPLAGASLDDAAALAKLVGSDIGDCFQVPVYLYEAAHPEGRALDVIRRELGYYRPNFAGNLWAGWALPDVLTERPSLGPMQVDRRKGVAMIGASPWLETYNVPIMSTDVVAARRVARRVSARGGGLPTVQTLGLVHGDDTTEIACMLLDPGRVGADRVQSRVEMLAAEEGLYVEKGYYTDLSQEMVTDRYLKLVSSFDA